MIFFHVYLPGIPYACTSVVLSWKWQLLFLFDQYFPTYFSFLHARYQRHRYETSQLHEEGNYQKVRIVSSCCEVLRRRSATRCIQHDEICKLWGSRMNLVLSSVAWLLNKVSVNKAHSNRFDWFLFRSDAFLQARETKLLLQKWYSHFPSYSIYRST